MTNLNFTDLPVIDGHIHYGNPAFMAGLMGVMERFQIGCINIVCTPHPERLSLVPDALHLKSHYPERVYVFGGLDISALYLMPEQAGEFFAGYVDTLLAMGCDGIKMHEGKPTVRQSLPIPDFDSDVYAPYWEKLAQTGTPLLFHVNDPEEFWDAERVPDWAVEQGWFYSDDTFIDNEAQYTQVLNVLERHPNLNVIFAHFFFLSAQLERLVGYLERYPNMCVDLTPGIEMYDNFATDPAAAREFFIKYQDRIVYGTDIGAKALLDTPELGIELDESQARVDVVRGFLEKDGPFTIENKSGFLFGDLTTPFHGIHLPESVLEKIYFRNFERLAGTRPRLLNPEAITAECERIIKMIEVMSEVQPDQTGDPSVAQMVKSYFEEMINQEINRRGYKQ